MKKVLAVIKRLDFKVRSSVQRYEISKNPRKEKLRVDEGRKESKCREKSREIGEKWKQKLNSVIFSNY